MLVSAGKHYINPDEISTIQYLLPKYGETDLTILAIYEFSMKNGNFIKLTEEEFTQFKNNCGRMVSNVF